MKNTTDKNQESILSWVPVVHACNPSYSGGRDQEDHGLKPVQQIVHKILSQKNPIQKRAGRVAQDVGPEFKPQYGKKIKKKKKKEKSTFLNELVIMDHQNEIRVNTR
jgi:hypothetical protein